MEVMTVMEVMSPDRSGLACERANALLTYITTYITFITFITFICDAATTFPVPHVGNVPFCPTAGQNQRAAAANYAASLSTHIYK